MTCNSCGHDNRPGAKFCEECAAPLKRLCASCNAELRPTAKFCDECGAPTATRSADPGTRKIITIVFADLVGSTALHERLDPESAGRFMESYYGAMRTVVEAHNGTVIKLLGDGVTAVFGAPRVAEDDAIRAVRAAVAMQQSFRELSEQQSGAVGKTGLRVAVNTGEVVASEDAEIIGDPVNVAARLQEQGREGDVVIGESTQRLVATLVTLAPLGSFTLKGRTEAVKAYRVVSLERPVGVTAVPFVGRDAELARIKAVYEAATKTPATRLAVLLGSPGLGKSRLIDEFTSRLGDTAMVLAAHCDAAGGATFAPLADALRKHLHVDDGASSDVLRTAIEAALPGENGERARIAGGIGALLTGSPAAPEETFFVVRRMFAALAATKPVVLVIDDLHWAEPLLLDLVEHLVHWGSGVPLLVLVGARPELRDARSSLAASGGLVADAMTLTGLDAGAATRLAANVIGASDLPAAVAIKVLATSEGNPLFVGELVRMLVDEGALRQEGDRWTVGAELAALEMPPTIHALLAARIERLRPEDRAVLERAAVVGRHFSRGAVAELLPGDAKDLGARLESLRRSELIEPDTGWFLGEPALRFHHVLIRDAAYRRLLKNTRADLHARLADWIEARAGDSVEHDETIGWHLEQAHQHLRELGPLDAQGRSLGERAARRLAAAGRRALARDDVPLAASLLGRALERLDTEDPQRAELALDWCEALLSAGDVGPAATAIDELGRFIEGSDRLRAWHTCFKGQLTVLTAPQALHAADAVAAAAAELATLGDAAGEAKAHFVHALALARLGKVGACEAALDRALAAARRAGDRRRANAVLAGAPLAALWGPSPVTRASGRCLDVVRVLRITQGAPAVEAVALSCQGVLEALRGRTDAARRMIASSRKMVEELGITHRLLQADAFAARIELLEGNAAAAERGLRRAYEGLRDLGLGIDAAGVAALLARALLAQDRAAEAESLSHESEALAGDDLQAAIAWRCVRAEALARRGEHAAAVELARAAVEIATATDALLDHADARLALAAALRAAGRNDDAAAEERRAQELWEAKGATLLAERAARPDESRKAVVQVTDDLTRPPRRRPVRANAATATKARFDAALAARDAAAIAALYSEDYEEIDHPTGSTYGRDGAIESLQRLLRSQNPSFHEESIATLGESLHLTRRRLRASGARGRHYDVGEFDNEALSLMEVDESGLFCRQEVFAPGRLGDAVARLYARYAELLPPGPARTRAEVTARSVATVNQAVAASDADSCATAVSPTLEFTDHRRLGLPSARGAEAVLRVVRALSDLAGETAVHEEEILGLESDAYLVRDVLSGTDRASGGRFEFPAIGLSLFGTDGLMVVYELFDVDRHAAALARFDELTAKPAPRPVSRRVRPNAATVAMARIEAGFRAGDLAAVDAMLGDRVETVDHPTGSTYGREGQLESSKRMLRMPGLTFRVEPLATLGETLSLFRRVVTARGTAGGAFDVAAYEMEHVGVNEADETGRLGRSEVFAPNQLGDAVARLYEYYAELLPEGPERARAAATARSVAGLAKTFEIEQFVTTYAPTVEVDDHRSVGFGALHGRAALFGAVRALLDLSEGFDRRIDDVLAASPGALLIRDRSFGTDRKSGGTFERSVCELLVYGADGLVARWERFDVGHEAEALARFDELVASPAVKLAAEPAKTHPVLRRLRSNAATATQARFVATFATGDEAALEKLFSEALEVVDHPNAASYGRDGQLDSLRRLRRARDPQISVEPLATLGESLQLSRRSIRASATAGGRFDTGAWERAEIVIFEVDERGRFCRLEIFATDHLGDAIARLYDRYAESLPQETGRARAAVVARAAAYLLTPAQADDAENTLFAPTYEDIDHRTVGYGALSRDQASNLLGSLHEVAGGLRYRIDDVFALCPSALVRKTTGTGVWRDGGGAFERTVCSLTVFGPDGRVTRHEIFDVGHEAEALARFDALTSGPAEQRAARRRVRPNTATAVFERYDAAIMAGDFATLEALLSETFVEIDHLSGATYGRAGALDSDRLFLNAQEPRLRHEVLATLGESLIMDRRWFSASGASGERFDVAEWEKETIALGQIDENGRIVRTEIFAADHLAEATVRIYEWYAEILPDGPKRTRATAMARSGAAVRGPMSLDGLGAIVGPDVEFVDHRPVGFPSSRGREAYLRLLRSLLEASDDTAIRVDDVLDVRPDSYLLRIMNFGTDRTSGGAFERPCLLLARFDADGLATHWELFDPDREAEALARFDELVGSEVQQPATYFANAASRSLERNARCWAARDWEGAVAILSPALRFDDRRRMMRLEIGYGDFVTQFRMLFDQPASRWHETLLATRGERLSLTRTIFEADVAGGGGPLAFDEHLSLTEVDADGRWIAAVTFDLDDEDAAYAELEARYEAGEAATHPVVAGPFTRAIARRDWEAVAALCAPTFVQHDHRRLAMLGTTLGPEAWAQNFRALVDLAPDTTVRFDHARQNARGVLVHFVWQGSRDGGTYELPGVAVFELDERDRFVRNDFYDPEQLDQAVARFEDLKAPLAGSKPLMAPFANAATRLNERFSRAWVLRDWDTITLLHAPTFHGDDRRLLMHMQVSFEDHLAQLRVLLEVPESRWLITPIATRGERLALSRMVFEGNVDAEGGGLAIDFLCVDEVDAEGRSLVPILFDPDDLDAAYAELDRRYETGDAATYPPLASVFTRAIATGDWDALIALCAPTLVEYDHRPLAVLGTTRGPEAWVQNFRTQVELAPDTVLRANHVRHGAHGLLFHLMWQGSLEGGAYEIPLVAVLEFDEGGKIARADIYDHDQLDQALARFEEITTRATRGAPVGATADTDTAVTPFANAATRAVGRGAAALAARDWHGFAALFAAEFRTYDRTPMAQFESDRESLNGFRQIVEMTSGPPTLRVLATRGDRLTLCRMHWQGAAGDVGPSEIDWLAIIEVNTRGEYLTVVSLDPDDLDAAYVELDARYDAGEGAQSRAWATSRTVGLAIDGRDWDSFLRMHAPGFVMEDHRQLGWGTTIRDRATYVRTQQVLVELAPDVRYRLDHFRMCARGHLYQVAQVGTRDGGAFETQGVHVSELDELGRVQRLDAYDLDDVGQACARFEELTARAVHPQGFANTVSRAMARWERNWAARNWDAVTSVYAPAYYVDDRRSLMHMRLAGEDFFAHLRMLFYEVAQSRWHFECIATRGERLVLSRVVVDGEVAEGGGPLRNEHLQVDEIDAEARFTASIAFDLDDADVAYAELETRYEAGEGAVHGALTSAYLHAVVSRDWDAVAAMCAPTFVQHDHRALAVLGSTRGPEAWVQFDRVLVELAPDSVPRVNHVRHGPRGMLWQSTWHGSHQGSRYEIAFVGTSELNAAGKFARIDLYDPEQLDQARARFDEICASAPRDPLAALAKPNAAVATFERWLGTFEAALDTDDWEALRPSCAAGMIFEDRRRFVLLSGDVELLIASARERARAGARVASRLIGTAGDRVAIWRTLWSGGPPNGRFEIEYFTVAEVDEAGLLAAMIFFDLDDPRAAQREAWARWAAIDPAAAAVAALIGEQVDAFNEHDPVKYRADFADDLIVEDHRRTGMGRIEGADAYVTSVVALWELTPVSRADGGWLWPACRRNGAITVVRRTGTVSGGGEFESEYLYLYTVAGGRVTRVELFEPEDLDAALARFAELRPDPLRIPLNAATRAIDQINSYREAGDWDAMCVLCAPVVFEDRRHLFRTTGDCELLVANSRFLAKSGARPARNLLATAGDRLALHRAMWISGGEGQPFEVEMLDIFEVDAEGRVVAAILFDPDDRAAASAELFERYLASGADGMSPSLIEFGRALNTHDLDRARGALHDNFVLDDHRLARLGRIEGADAYIASMVAAYELSSDLSIQPLYVASAAPHGGLMVMRAAGKNSEGGEFEILYVSLMVRRGQKIAMIEFFEPEDLDAALARFEELRPNPRQVPPNAATRTRARWQEATEAHDWAAVRALVSDDFRYEDRGKRALVSGDVETWITSMQFNRALPGFQNTHKDLATLGDRILLDRLLWTGGADGNAFETEHIWLIEVDADGRLRAVMLFDPDDRPAAFLEGLERFVAGEGAATGGQTSFAAFMRAFSLHEWERVREIAAPDWVMVDQRTLGLGTLDRDQWVTSLRAQAELAPDLAAEAYRVLAWNRHGLVTLCRTFGTVPDGGPFENFFIIVVLTAGDRLQRQEVFDLDDADRALARFEELCAARQ